MQNLKLRQSGLQVSRLGIGTGTHGWNGNSDQTRIGFNNLVNLLRFAHDQGIMFWDTAEGYGSHQHIGEALKSIDRSSVTIMTKTFSKNPEQVNDAIPKFLKELGTDYIDILLMHCISQKDWLTAYSDVIDLLQRIKAKGLVKAIGMSCHDFGALQTVADTEWIDVVFARINYDSVNMDTQTEKVAPELERIHNAGKDVIAMKAIGQGKLVESREKSLEYVLGLSSVDAIIVGMTSEDQIRENVATFDNYLANKGKQ